MNAAKNILLLLTTWIEGRERPDVFCVPSKNTVSPKAKEKADERSATKEGFYYSREQINRYPGGQDHCENGEA